MWYWILGLAFGGWVFFDAVKRRVGRTALVWAFSAVVAPFIAVPIYAADRPLLPGEVREGGKGWNILRNFALTWTVFMAVATVVAVSGVTNAVKPTSEAEAAGAAIGTALGVGVLAAIWFFPMVGAVVLGFILKKSSIVERGPDVPAI